MKNHDSDTFKTHDSDNDVHIILLRNNDSDKDVNIILLRNMTVIRMLI